MEKKLRKRRSIKIVDDRYSDAQRNEKIKSFADFDQFNSNNVKYFPIKSNDEVSITTCFTSGKMVKFTKVFLASFIFDITDILCFPDNNLVELFKEKRIIKRFAYLLFADTHSKCTYSVIVPHSKSPLFAKNSLIYQR